MILTREYLTKEAKKVPYVKRTLYESLKFDTTKKYDIFISHSYNDREMVNTLYDLFEKCGYNVFIDWKEDSLKNRDEVSKETAIKLKKSMVNRDGLLYLATTNTTNSKWCPWELGYVDGLKNRVAILPVLKEESCEYKGQEYLGIYPYIDYSKIDGKDSYDFWVCDSKNPKKYSSLKNWLKTGELKLHQNPSINSCKYN